MLGVWLEVGLSFCLVFIIRFMTGPAWCDENTHVTKDTSAMHMHDAHMCWPQCVQSSLACA